MPKLKLPTTKEEATLMYNAELGRLLEQLLGHIVIPGYRIVVKEAAARLLSGD